MVSFQLLRVAVATDKIQFVKLAFEDVKSLNCIGLSIYKKFLDFIWFSCVLYFNKNSNEIYRKKTFVLNISGIRSISQTDNCVLFL